jgi:hypothetical protein
MRKQRGQCSSSSLVALSKESGWKMVRGPVLDCTTRELTLNKSAVNVQKLDNLLKRWLYRNARAKPRGRRQGKSKVDDAANQCDFRDDPLVVQTIMVKP